METGRLVFNGINGETGEYLLPGMAPRQFSQAVLRQALDAGHIREIRRWMELRQRDHLGPREGVDPRDLAQSGWGVVFADDAPPALREGLRELLDLRREQAGELYQEIVYRRESKQDFLARFGAGPGPADPRRIPYYLLIVGSPERIPYAFQYQLDVQYAVGRLWLDEWEDYALYAETVVRAERGLLRVSPRAAVFGPRNDGDEATALSHDDLALPVSEALGRLPGWSVSPMLAANATKPGLLATLTEDRCPALLFTAGHGIGYPKGHPRQRSHQGALLCQEWPGPSFGHRALPPEHYLAAEDLGDGVRVPGLVSFHFACYSGGTPERDGFPGEDSPSAELIAEAPFVARLPQRLLRAGALAVVGHVDKAFECSFRWPGAGAQTEVFESAFRRLAAGHPVGSAMEFFNQRYAELSSVLAEELQNVRLGMNPDPEGLTALWTAYNDSRTYLVLGDPAVRLPVSPEPAERDAS